MLTVRVAGLAVGGWRLAAVRKGTSSEGHPLNRLRQVLSQRLDTSAFFLMKKAPFCAAGACSPCGEHYRLVCKWLFPSCGGLSRPRCLSPSRQAERLRSSQLFPHSLCSYLLQMEPSVFSQVLIFHIYSCNYNNISQAHYGSYLLHLRS